MEQLREDLSTGALEHWLSNISALLVRKQPIAPEDKDAVRLVFDVWLLGNGQGKHPRTVTKGQQRYSPGQRASPFTKMLEESWIAECDSEREPSRLGRSIEEGFRVAECLWTLQSKFVPKCPRRVERVWC